MSENTTRTNLEDLDEHEDRTDWDRLEEMTDEEIEAAVEDDEAQDLLPAEWFRAATLVDPSADKKRITIRLDEDIVEFFKDQGGGYQTRINRVLRAYVLIRKLRGLMAQDTEQSDAPPLLNMIQEKGGTPSS